MKKSTSARLAAGAIFASGLFFAGSALAQQASFSPGITSSMAQNEVQNEVLGNTSGPGTKAIPAKRGTEGGLAPQRSFAMSSTAQDGNAEINPQAAPSQLRKPQASTEAVMHDRGNAGPALGAGIHPPRGSKVGPSNNPMEPNQQGAE